jgi:hypothetical protein
MPFLERERDGEPFVQAEFEECLRASVAEVVGEQVRAGIDIVSDGEFGKTINWYIYVNERLGGLEHRPTQAGPDFLSQSACPPNHRVGETPHDRRGGATCVARALEHLKGVNGRATIGRGLVRQVGGRRELKRPPPKAAASTQIRFPR